MFALLLLLTLLCPGRVAAVETAPRIADREIVERLTKLEAGHAHLTAALEANTAAIDQLRADVQTHSQQLRQDMNALGQQLRQSMDIQNEQLRQDMDALGQQLRQSMDIQNEQLRQDMNALGQQLRQDMNAQFDRLSQLMLGILGAFTALVVVTIGFALWDRRTMTRPFEDKVKIVEDELSKNRERLHALLEALRALGQSDKQLAEVLRQFRLL